MFCDTNRATRTWVAVLFALGLANASPGDVLADSASRPQSPADDFFGGLESARLAYFHSLVLGYDKRVAGTRGEKNAAKYIAHQLRRSGYRPRIQKFDAITAEPVLWPPEGSQWPNGYTDRVEEGKQPVVSRNIIAEKRGARYPHRVLVLGAHYDSVAQSESTGYSDNASGAGLTLGLAQALARRHVPFTIRFVFFGAEESCPSYVDYCVKSGLAGTGGLKGSTAYTAGFSPDDVNRTVGMLNLDTVVGGDFIYSHGASQGADGWIRERVLRLADEYGLRFRVNPGHPIPYANGEVLYPEGTTGSWSDHFPFQKKGIEIGSLEATNWDIGELDGYEQSAKLLNETGDGAIWHTDRDTARFLRQSFPGRVARQTYQVAAVVYRFLRDPGPPSELSPGALARREASICAEVIGKKVAGEAGERKMRNYVLKRLRQMGYAADVQAFTIPEGARYSAGLTSHNVFAVKPGDSDMEFVIGSHYDSVPQNLGNGYTDNCSGAATSLALADIVKDEALPVSLRFVFFGAEEIGKLGSQAYVAAMDGSSVGRRGLSLGDIRNVKGMLNLDTTWGGDIVYVHGASQGSQGWIREQLLAIAESQGHEFQRNPGNFINVDYWFGDEATVPRDTACVAGATYDEGAAEIGEPLTVADFSEGELIDTSAQDTVVLPEDYCVFLPEGITGDWSDHFPFQSEGKEIAYIEATNFDIADFDGYQQSEKLFEEYKACIDNPMNDPADCGDAAGAIWHTDRDEYSFVNETFPGRVQEQSAQILDVLLAFLREPEVPLVARTARRTESISARAEAVSARSSDQRERVSRQGLRLRLRAFAEGFDDRHASVDLLLEALRRGTLEDSALASRIPPQARAQLEALREEFADLLNRNP